MISSLRKLTSTGYALAGSIALLHAGALYAPQAGASEFRDMAECARWRAVIGRIAADRDEGVSFESEMTRLAEMEKADRALPEPMLFRDQNDESYAVMSSQYVYANPQVGAVEMAGRFFHSCAVRVQATHDAPSANAGT